MRYFVFGITGIAGMLVLFALYNPALLAFIAVHIALSAVNISILNKKQYELDKRQLKWQRFADYYHGLVGGKGSAKELRIYRLRPFIFDRWIKFYEKLRLERLDLELEGTRNFNRYSLVKFFLWATALAVLFWGIYNKRCDIGVFVMLFGLV
ncbi:MAG: hypothetical protein LBG76_06400, partial [Treponema sp.]|nr:hypothetical protein [Treponema sp.]